MRKPIGIVLISIGIFLFLFVLYTNSMVSKQTRIFSAYSLLTSSWQSYASQFIQKNGRSVDPGQKNVTTSEAQSYALLRAVWSDDRPTFDKVLTFTRTYMKRPTDHLFGWRYGKLQNGKYGFLPGGGENAAADADTDIAFALILASRRWHDPIYLSYAKPLIADIWRNETAIVRGKRYLIAGNWAQDNQKIIINVSYFAPYAWRAFATIDTKDDWQSLLAPAYQLLTDAGTAPLDTGKGVGLPPDWVAMNRTTGELSATNISSFTTHYSFDAMRTPWRIALDYLWNKDPRAKTYLLDSYTALANDYKQHHTLAALYSHDGKRLTAVENPAMYATSLGYFIIADKKTADQLYQNKIIRLYSNDKNTFNPKLPYYEQNWLWFGAALYNNYLSDFR